MSTSSPTVAPPPHIFADSEGGINMQSIAAELAAGLFPAPEIWARHGVSRETAERISRTPLFMRHLAEARDRWHSDDNAAERIRKKAQVAIEQGLADLFSDSVNPKIPLNHRVKGFEMLSRWAGFDAAGVNGPGGVAGVSIRIDLSGRGNDGPVVTANVGGAIEQADAGPAPAAAGRVVPAPAGESSDDWLGFEDDDL